MVRSVYVLVALLIPGAAAAQTITLQDGSGQVVTATRQLDGAIRLDAPVVQGGVIVNGVVPPAGTPPRDTRPLTGSSVIRGRVVDASNGNPLRKASVRIFSGEIRESRVATTDTEGRYEFTDLPAGQFNVNVTKAGYVDLGYGQTSPFEVGKPLKVGDRQVVEKINFSLPRGAVITGRVLDEYGEPIADVQVGALRNQFTPTGPRPSPSGRMGTTNDIGEFRLFGLAPGQYFISATFRSQSMMPGATTSDSSGYAVTYYPGTANLADAQKFTIGLGGSITDVTVMLVPTRTARVSGIVIDEQGRPVRQGSVMLMARNAGMMMSTASGPIRPDGTFSVGGVSPGEYVVRGMIPGQPGLPPNSPMAAVSVNGIDVTDIRVEPARPITVSGHVVLDPVALRSFKPETMRLNASPSEPGPFFGPIAPPAAIRDDLTFEFKASPGPSIVRLASSPGWMVKSVFLNGADVTDGITFSNDDVSGLEVELTNKVPDVSGVVTNGRGEPVIDYFAIAFPQDTERWNAPGPGRTAMVRPDDQGRFHFRTLRPGNYYVVALEHVQNGEWMDPAFMEFAHTRATRLLINEGDTQTLDLKLLQAR